MGGARQHHLNSEFDLERETTTLIGVHHPPSYWCGGRGGEGGVGGVVYLVSHVITVANNVVHLRVCTKHVGLLPVNTNTTFQSKSA